MNRLRPRMSIPFSILAGVLIGYSPPYRITRGDEPALRQAADARFRDGAVIRTRGEVTPASPTHAAAIPAPVGEDRSGALPLNACIQKTLEANALVHAARCNVEALRQRIPQVTSLDDPILSNSIFPIPSVAPQYSLMGYMPYGTLLAQQFPWCGTLRLRGQAAGADVRIALFELAATELDAVAGVKRAYYDLHLAERTQELLRLNRILAVDFLKLARRRYPTATASQVDVLRAEVALSDVDREIESNRMALNQARSELVRLMHAGPESEPRTVPRLAPASAPGELERLQQLAVASRPDLQGRLAAIARDQVAVELARKRYYPNVTAGIVYQDMEKTNAMAPRTAGGMPNVGLFVGLNLPVYRKKIAAGVLEAKARAAADRALYEAERDQSDRDIKDLFVQAQVQQNVLTLLRNSNLATARRVLALTTGDYRAGSPGVDLLSVISASRDVLQLELQVAQVEAELAKAMASLERAVGVQLNQHPLPPSTPAVPPTPSTSPFRLEERPSNSTTRPDPPSSEGTVE